MIGVLYIESEGREEVVCGVCYRVVLLFRFFYIYLVYAFNFCSYFKFLFWQPASLEADPLLTVRLLFSAANSSSTGG